MLEQLSTAAETVEKDVSPNSLFDHRSSLSSSATEKARTAVKRAMADRSTDIKDELASLNLDEIDVVFSGRDEICTCWFDFEDRPSFTPALLNDIGKVQQSIRSWYEKSNGRSSKLKYLVWGSRMPGVWNLGGDLSLFSQLIQNQEREKLREYAYRVVREGYANWTSLNVPIITVALIQGDALGGGFEAALSSNVIVAERSAKFGLPEILFSLFPGMGAYSFLSRRIAPGRAERMIMSGRLYTAEELYEMGVVDVLADDGHGEEALHQYVAKNERRHAAHRAIFQARQRINPVTLKEMMDITDLWVETAMTLDEADLKKMGRLVSAQDRRRNRVLKSA
ncbi:crotonase/enoyl-CoA hydratase family protein [Pelagibius sp. Alg239-R121]|uniref:crotonase/enoyl-CoA hydratase family protein n=1 Tax=Pelagibius sp. Alg239-R121 TaxID=2993448 RepID=UPI0024A771FC|nr:crotonase/enoyl-CoA hydratase family protein [Pelagibius sp. Alg239-R121]